MIYAVLTAIIGVVTYLLHLRSKVSSLTLENTVLKDQSQTREWDDKIKESKSRVEETEREYNEARDGFRRKHSAVINGDNKSE